MGFERNVFSISQKVEKYYTYMDGIFHSIFGAAGRGPWDLRGDRVEVREAPAAVIFSVVLSISVRTSVSIITGAVIRNINSQAPPQTP